jgi:hypothetical protein
MATDMEKISKLLEDLGFDDFIFVGTKGPEVTLSLCDNAITALGMIDYARIEAHRQIGGHNDEDDKSATQLYRN